MAAFTFKQIHPSLRRKAQRSPIGAAYVCTIVNRHFKLGKHYPIFQNFYFFGFHSHRCLKHTRRNFEKGMSLISMISTVLAAILILSISIPQVGNIQQSTLSNELAEALLKDLNLTRNEAAVRSAQSIVFCASSNGEDCNSQVWENGWISFLDLNKDKRLSPSSGEEIIRHKQYALLNNSIRAKGFTQESLIVYNALGQPDSTGILLLCDSRGVDHIKIIAVLENGKAELVQNTQDIISYLEATGESFLSCP